MKAIVIEETGGPEKLLYKDVPIPEVKEGMVLVKNHFIGINFIDTYFRSGHYPSTLPSILGVENAGEIVGIGPGVVDLNVGDRVVVIGTGAYAEYSVHTTEMVAKITDDKVSYQDAAVVFGQGLTAVTVTNEAYTVKKGDVVLIHAAAGGVGLMLVQVCHYLGATVIGTVSTLAKAEIARAHGADYVINYAEEDVVAKVNEFTNGLGCHVVYDGVGKDTIEASFGSVRRLGTVVVYGQTSGPVPPIAVDQISAKNLKFISTRLYTSLATAAERQRWFGELFDLVGNGHIKPFVYKVYDLKDAAQAHIDLESRKSMGKLLLKP